MYCVVTRGFPGAVVSVSSNPEVVGRIYLGQLSTAPFEAPQDSRGHVNASKDPSQGSSSARRAKDITYLQVLPPAWVTNLSWSLNQQEFIFILLDSTKRRIV